MGTVAAISAVLSIIQALPAGVSATQTLVSAVQKMFTDAKQAGEMTAEEEASLREHEAAEFLSPAWNREEPPAP